MLNESTLLENQFTIDCTFYERVHTACISLFDDFQINILKRQDHSLTSCVVCISKTAFSMCFCLKMCLLGQGTNQVIPVDFCSCLTSLLQVGVVGWGGGVWRGSY